MAKERLVVIGGDAAGMSAASKARRLRADLDIVVFERSPHTSYSACGIPYYVAGLVESEGDLIARTPEKFREKYDIDARVLHEVVQIDPPGRRVQVRDCRSGGDWWESYDQLLIATGAIPFCPALPGADAQGIFGISTLESGIRVRRVVDEERPRRAVVVGGGYIGLEMAEAFVLRGMDVSLVSRGPEVMETLDHDMGRLISEALRQVGVKLFLNESLRGFEVREGRVAGVITDQRSVPADIVVLGMGVQPNSALAKAAGIPLGTRGAIRVNTRMQTETEGIWAAGDCVESFHLISRKPYYVALGTVANKQGLVAGTNLGGEYAVFPGVVGTAVSKICKYEVGRTGLHEREIRGLGL
jgi:NADPH-dependent 2,4-dienoyl-CoA reductase/sulfur reductase-like enzyme